MSQPFGEARPEYLAAVGRSSLELRSIANRHDCYIERGIVGDMFDELYLADPAWPGPVARRHARARGRREGLAAGQYLKDADAYDSEERR